MQIPLPGPGDITVKEEGVVLCSWRAQMCNRQVTKNMNAVNEINRVQHWSMMWAGACALYGRRSYLQKGDL